MTSSSERRLALVTGAGTRLGRSFALALARSNFDVILHYRTSEEEARRVHDEISRLGTHAHLVQYDLRDAEAPREIAEEIRNYRGKLDVLVNSASSYPDPQLLVAKSDFLSESIERWDEALTVNARAPFFLIQALVPLLKRGIDPCVVNVLDTSVSSVWASRSAHTISKRALAAVTEVAAQALAPSIRVNALELGRILPQPAASPTPDRASEWGGPESAVKALQFILESPFLMGETVRVAGAELLGPQPRR